MGPTRIVVGPVLAAAIAAEMLGAVVAPAGQSVPMLTQMVPAAWAGRGSEHGEDRDDEGSEKECETRAHPSRVRRPVSRFLAAPGAGTAGSAPRAGATSMLDGRPLLEDPAAVEEADGGGDVAREAHLVGGQHHRGAGLGQVADDGEHVADQLGVEGRGDLVEQQQLGLGAERADQGGPLLLAAREPVGVLVHLVG